MVHYDLLRVIAAFSVVMLHSAAQFWYTLDVNDIQWKIANTYDALFRFGVPIFVMISGALFLGGSEKLNVKRLYAHNILRLAVIYIIWSCAYGLLDCRRIDWNYAGWKDVVREMISGRYHLWFLPMIVGIYVLLPVLRTWVRNAEKQNLQYFIGLFFVLQILRETLSALTTSDEFQTLLDLTRIELVCSYIGYFVWGYYIAHVGIPKKYHRWIYLSVIPSAVLNVALGNGLAVKAGVPVGTIYDSYGLFTFLTVTALFLFFAEVMSGVTYRPGMGRVLRELSGASLGIYVLHVGVMELTENIGIHSMVLPIGIGIPVYAVFCFLICYLLAAVLRRIPLIGRYLC